MKKSVAMKWVKALRSGKYKQAKNQLHSDAGYCCFGVLCAISPKKRFLGSHIFGGTLLAQPAVLEFSELNTGNGSIDTLDGQTISLIDLNDTKGFTFDEIADIIQVLYEEL